MSVGFDVAKKTCFSFFVYEITSEIYEIYEIIYEITCGTSLVTKYPVAQSLLPTVNKKNKKKKNKDKHLNSRMFSQKVYCEHNKLPFYSQ